MPIPERPAVNDDHEYSIVLSEQDVRAAARLFRTLKAAVDYPIELDEGQQQQLGEEELVSRARIIVHSRRARSRYFKRGIFGEPAWDILLLLYIAETAGDRQTITKIAKRIDAPVTTVIRWLSYLEGEELIEREPHPTDKRTAYIRLAAKARQAMRQYLSASTWQPTA